MFEYVKSFIASRVEHPMLMTLLLVGAGFAVAGITVETTTGNGVASGFLVIYAGMAFLLSVLGYAIIFTARIATRFRKRTGSVG